MKEFLTVGGWGEWMVAISGYGKSFNTEGTEKPRKDTEDILDRVLNFLVNSTPDGFEVIR